MHPLLQLLKIICWGLCVNSQVSITDLSDLQSFITNTTGSLDVELSGAHTLSTGISVPVNTQLRVSSLNGAQVTCVNETFAFDTDNTLARETVFVTAP